MLHVQFRAQQHENLHDPFFLRLSSEPQTKYLGVFQQPLTLITLQKCRDTDGSRIMIQWESAKVSHKRVFALMTPEIHSHQMVQMLQKPAFALPGCQQMSVNTLLCNTLGLADTNWWCIYHFLPREAYFCKSIAVETEGISQCFSRGQQLNTNFFSQTFRAPPGYPSKIPGYPAQKV